MIKFPYGIANFYAIITDGYYYVGRTDRIRFLEETGSMLLFLRLIKHHWKVVWYPSTR
jgi:hypothetical protein